MGGAQGRLPIPGEPHGCHGNPSTTVSRGDEDYITFHGTAGAEGERSSAWHPHKGLNFHKTEGKECEGGTQRGGRVDGRETGRDRAEDIMQRRC